MFQSCEIEMIVAVNDHSVFPDCREQSLSGIHIGRSLPLHSTNDHPSKDNEHFIAK